jgi:hypothetical protein
MEAKLKIAMKVLSVAALLAALTGCPSKDDSNDRYACVWESRHSACGGGSYTAWATQCDEFLASDYYISPQEHCANMASSDTSCAGDCCIYVEGRNPTLQAGGSCN